MFVYRKQQVDGNKTPQDHILKRWNDTIVKQKKIKYTLQLKC